MNNTIKILQLFIVICIIAIISLLYITNEKNKLFYNGLLKDSNAKLKEISLKYDSLLNAKQYVIVYYDTIYDTIIIKSKPINTKDTIINKDTLKANYYNGIVSDTAIEIKYSAITFGTLEELNFTYKYFDKTKVISNILYIDKPYPVKEWYPKNHLYINYESNFGDMYFHGIDLLYTTKNGFLYKTGLLLEPKEKSIYYKVGFGIKLF